MVSKKGLIELLKDRGVYDEVDDVILSEFFTCLKMIRAAKKDINERGNLTACDKEGKILQQNPSIAIYNTHLKNLLNLSRKFGLTPRDRMELNLESGGEGIEL